MPNFLGGISVGKLAGLNEFFRRRLLFRKPLHGTASDGLDGVGLKGKSHAGCVRCSSLLCAVAAGRLPPLVLASTWSMRVKVPAGYAVSQSVTAAVICPSATAQGDSALS